MEQLILETLFQTHERQGGDWIAWIYEAENMFDLMQFNKQRCKVLPLGNNNLLHQYTLGTSPSGRQLCREGPRVPEKGLGKQQADCEPAKHTCHKEGQKPPELH